MSDNPMDYGVLLNKDIKLHRMWFRQMTSLIGVNVLYRAPLPGKKVFDRYGDLVADYEKGYMVGCIFNDHPDQKTMKMLGWDAELQEGTAIIHVPYDLKNLQRGCLFELPSGLDNGKRRVFRVIDMQNSMIYPSSIACELAPEFKDIDEPVIHTDFDNKDLSLLKDNDWDD